MKQTLQEKTLMNQELSWTRANRVSTEDSLIISHEQLNKWLQSQPSGHLSTLGKDGKRSIMEWKDIATQWFATLPKKERVKYSTLILGCFTLPIRLGELLPVSNSSFVKGNKT
jgi:hypothetical protein